MITREVRLAPAIRGNGWGKYLVAAVVSLVSGCATAAGPVVTPSPVVSPAPAGAVGYLEGRAAIGPLTPVEKVGVPSPTPSPAMCTAQGLTIHDARSSAEVARFSLQPDCTYRVALKPGRYVVDLMRTQGIGGSKDLPKTVDIEGGRTLRLDISIDTGIR